MTLPTLTLGRIIAVLVLVVAVISLLVPVSVERIGTWLVAALAVAIIIG